MIFDRRIGFRPNQRWLPSLPGPDDPGSSSVGLRPEESSIAEAACGLTTRWPAMLFLGKNFVAKSGNSHCLWNI
jgi:hypothetical protein